MRKYVVSEEVYQALNSLLDKHDKDVKKLLEEHLWRLSGKGGEYRDELAPLNTINMTTMTFIMHLGYEKSPTQDEVLKSLNEYQDLISGLDELDWDHQGAAIAALKRILGKTGI
ncbi:hypothetical protein LIS04_08 [Listeria phage LIS04]|nr:hypothetical protein LIS04_08 [Listeria phage LIS04]